MLLLYIYICFIFLGGSASELFLEFMGGKAASKLQDLNEFSDGDNGSEYEPFLPSVKRWGNKGTNGGGVADRCCVQRCSYSVLMSYCCDKKGIDKPAEE